MRKFNDKRTRYNKKLFLIVEKIDNQFFCALSNYEEVFINLLYKLSNFDCKEFYSYL